MPDSINPTDIAFLKECQDLMALLDHTERLLHGGRQITPLAAAMRAHSFGLLAAESNNGGKKPCLNM